MEGASRDQQEAPLIGGLQSAGALRDVRAHGIDSPQELDADAPLLETRPARHYCVQFIGERCGALVRNEILVIKGHR